MLVYYNKAKLWWILTLWKSCIAAVREAIPFQDHILQLRPQGVEI
jgi:hypothetical protein